MTEQLLTTRTEILFVYDITDANPNGDPNDENRPRMDVETSRAKISDVRLKRTVRDYLHDYCGEEIFVREIEKEDGTIQAGKDRAEDFNGANAKNVLEKRDQIQEAVIAKCIDVRLFGATIPVAATKKNEKDSSVTLTGPVQFAMGTSLHRVEPRFIKGTGAFASGHGREQKTFREEHVLPYALVAFYGIVNQQAAKTTQMTADDAEMLYEAIWYGTKNLITRSKIGQRPLLLLLVEYSEKHANSYIGRLDRFLALKNADARDEAIRNVEQVTLDLTKIQDALKGRKEKINRIRYVWDKRLTLDPAELAQAFDGIKIEQLNYD